MSHHPLIQCDPDFNQILGEKIISQIPSNSGKPKIGIQGGKLQWLLNDLIGIRSASYYFVAFLVISRARLGSE